MIAAKTAAIIVFLFTAIILFPVSSASDFFLEETLFEGEKRDFHEEGYPYKVTLIGVFDREGKAQFEVNGEKTDPLKESEMDRLADGSSIQVRSVIAQQGGADFVQYNFFPATKIEDVAAKEEPVPEKETVSAEPAQEPAPVEEETPDVEEIADMPEETTVEHKGFWRRFIDWLKGLF
ncbi:hypothetical protein KY362_05825 [Candidatus Woesearchaeota archaeon]|nr:hypothetical protein [Candidatus Woesearchaeota archaeon]